MHVCHSEGSIGPPEKTGWIGAWEVYRFVSRKQIYDILEFGILQESVLAIYIFSPEYNCSHRNSCLMDTCNPELILIRLCLSPIQLDIVISFNSPMST